MKLSRSAKALTSLIRQTSPLQVNHVGMRVEVMDAATHGSGPSWASI
jgi:hypothetical protein